MQTVPCPSALSISSDGSQNISTDLTVGGSLRVIGQTITNNIVNTGNLTCAGNTSTSGSATVGSLVVMGDTSFPAGTEGMIWYNKTDHHFYGYDGSTWKQLDN